MNLTRIGRRLCFMRRSWLSFFVFIMCSCDIQTTRTGFHLKERGENEWDIIFDNQPANLRALATKPLRREPELNKGVWLVMAYGVFSVQDRNNVEDLLRTIPSLRADLMIGVRAFWEFRDIKTWFPECREDAGSPVWVIFVDGKPVASRIELMTPDEIRAFVNDNLKK